MDSGYFSAKAAEGLEELGFDPYMATERQKHQAQRRRGVPAARRPEAMAAKVQSAAGQALYARRKVIVEPVFGQIKGRAASAASAAWVGEDQRRMAFGVPDA